MTATRDEFLPFVGPAASLPFWGFLARFPYRVALTIWTAILVSAYVVIVVTALRLAGAARDMFSYAGGAALAFSAAPMLSALALGQAALVSAAAIAAAMVAYRARWAVGAFAATLFSAVQPNLAFALVGRLRSRWDVVVASASGCTFILVTLFAGGGGHGFVAYLRRLGAHGDAERFVTIQHTPAAIAYAFGIPPSAATALGAGIAGLTIVATAIVIVRERLDATTATLVCCAALPLAIPFFHEHDFVLVIVPVLVLAIRARGRARTLAAIAAAFLLVDWFGLAQRHVAQGQIICLGLASAFAFLTLGPSRLRIRGELAGIALVALLAAVAVPLGRAHPAPTWPDTLPATYHADPRADASSVWADEQRTAGLDAVEPAWGALRVLPLVGCIALGTALVADARRRKRHYRQTRNRAALASTRSPVPV